MSTDSQLTAAQTARPTLLSHRTSLLQQFSLATARYQILGYI